MDAHKKFLDWVETLADGGHSQLARDAGVSKSYVSRVKAREQRPNAQFSACVARQMRASGVLKDELEALRFEVAFLGMELDATRRSTCAAAGAST